MDWIIANCNENKYQPDFKSIFSNNKHQLLIKNNVDSTVNITKQDKKCIFLTGYIIPRLASKIQDTSTSHLLNDYIKNGSDYINKYKGNFNIIIFDEEEILIFTDRMGILKFFYSNDDESFIASNRLHIIKKSRNFDLDLHNIYKYVIFNYQIKDTTFFKDLYKSEGGKVYRIKNDIKSENYFSSKDFLRGRKVTRSQKETFGDAPIYWKKLFKQYLNHFNKYKMIQTLTAGLDSRLMLAGFRKNGFNPDTFTFGNANSLDVKYAKKIARELNLQHIHLEADEKFYDNYKSYVDETIDYGDGLVSLFRAHRLNSYQKLKGKYDNFFFGFIGSEITRGGVYPDGLIFSPFLLNHWQDEKFDFKKFLQKNFIKVNDQILNEVIYSIMKYSFINNPDEYIFDVLIPLHFGQDIRLLHHMNINSIAPFWDIDFLEFQMSTPYFIDNTKKKELSTLGHFKRRKGPYYSTKLISIMDKPNAKLTLGKGYSPYDYQLSIAWAGFRFILYKILHKKEYNIPNFGYSKWFKKYLLESIKRLNSCYFNYIDLPRLECVLQSIDNREHGELNYLPFVKNLNIALNENFNQL